MPKTDLTKEQQILKDRVLWARDNMGEEEYRAIIWVLTGDKAASVIGFNMRHGEFKYESRSRRPAS